MTSRLPPAGPSREAARPLEAEDVPEQESTPQTAAAPNARSADRTGQPEAATMTPTDGFAVRALSGAPQRPANSQWSPLSAPKAELPPFRGAPVDAATLWSAQPATGGGLVSSSGATAPATGTGRGAAPPAVEQLVVGWASRGLVLDREQVDAALSATLSRPMTPRQLAAAVFDLREADVSARHVALLAASNPGVVSPTLDSQPLAAGTTIALAATPKGLRLGAALLDGASAELQAMIAGGAPRGSNGPLATSELLQLAEAKQRLSSAATDMRAGAMTADIDVAIGRAEARAERAMNLGDDAAVLQAFDGTRAEVRQGEGKSRAAASASSAAAELAFNLAESRALEQCAAGHLKRGFPQGAEQVFQAALARIDRTLEAPDLDWSSKRALVERKVELLVSGARADAAALMLVPQPKAVSAESLDAMGAKISTAFAKADELLAALEREDSARAPQTASPQEPPPTVEPYRTLRETYAALHHAARAELHLAAGDHSGQLQELESCLGRTLGLAPRETQALLAPDEQHSIASGGGERPWYRLDQYLASTTVGFLSPPRLEAAAAQLQALPTAKREQALVALATLASAAGSAGDVSRMNTARQLLAAVAKGTERPDLEARAAIADGAYLQSVGDDTGARAAYAEARTQAGQLEPSALREQLVSDAVQREAAALSRLSELAPRPERQGHAVALRALRADLESSGEGGAALAARVALIEIEAFLGANEGAAAQATFDHVRTRYGTEARTPWVRSALDKIERDSRDAPAVAFLQVALAEANTETMGEALAYGFGGMLAGAAVGAGVGVWAGGVGAIPGATLGALGALVGGGIGVGTLKARNLWRGTRNMMDAWQTGLNAQTWKTSLLDVTMLAVDAVTVAAPVKGLGTAGRGGLTALTGLGSAAAKREAQALTAGLTARVERAVTQSLGPDALATMSRAEVTTLARDLLAREMTKDAATFGGKASVAALGVVAGQFAAGFYDIQTSALSETQKATARAKLWSALAQAGLSLGLYGGVTATAFRYALNPAVGSDALRQALRDVAPRSATAVAMSQAEFDAVIAARKLEVQGRGLPPETLAQLNARYDAIAQHRVAAFDPVTGDVLVNRQAIERLPKAEAEAVVGHELSHLRFHELGPKALDGLVRAFTSHPNWKAIEAEYLRSHPEAKGFTASQLVDEVLATTHGDAGGASTLSRLAQPVLAAQVVRGSGLDVRPKVDLETLLTVGDLTVGRSAYYARSGETGLVGHSDAGGGPDAETLKKLLGETWEGKAPKMSADELKALQASALRVLDRTYTNDYGSDGALRELVTRKLAYYGDQRRGPEFDDAVFGGRSVADQQRRALRFVLQTFRSHDESDTALRREAFTKLAAVGKQVDITTALRAARKGNSSDLFHGLEAAKGIARREGTPQKRGPLANDPEIGPLLAKPSLTEAERMQAIEAILKRGEIDVAKTKRHQGTNLNRVYFLTFKDTLPGPDGTRVPVRAVFKPEATYVDKDRMFYAREVAAYEFDKQFAKTGLVPPTVEAILPWGTSGRVEIGSLQWMIADAEPLGRDVKPFLGQLATLRSEGKYNEALKLQNELVRSYDPKFKALIQTPDYQRQEAALRTLLYIYGDPDKLANNVFPNPNLQNIMIDKNGKLWMIDNSYSMGAPPREVSRDILPKHPVPGVRENLRQAPDVTQAMKDYLSDADAKDVARRADVVAKETHD